MGVGLREGTAAEAGLSAERLNRVRDLAQSFVTDGRHPSVVVLVARGGVVALHEAYGRLGPEPGDPSMSRNALFPIASVTKPVTATALMMLVEAGLVGLTRPVCEYIPEFVGGGKHTVFVHHLLTHTSGIAGPATGSDEFMDLFTGRADEPRRDPTLHPVIDKVLQFAYGLPVRNRPGTEMVYDTLNYELLGEVIRRASHQALPEFFADRIFGPLGMTDSYLAVSDGTADRVVRARADGPFGFAWSLPRDVPYAGNGVCATAWDMAVFAHAFLDRGRGLSASILGPVSVKAMTTNQIPGVPGELVIEHHQEASWGFGWGVTCHEKWSFFPTPPPGSFSHSGATGSYLWCDPDHDLVGVFFAPMNVEQPHGLVWWQADLFVNAVTAAIND